MKNLFCNNRISTFNSSPLRILLNSDPYFIIIKPTVKMKKILFIGAALFVLASCKSGKDKEAGKTIKYSDLTIDGLNGKVMSVEETPYQTDSTGKAGQMDSCCIGRGELDENGNYLSWTEKDSKGTVKNQSVFTRHPDGLWKGSKDTKDGKPSASMETTVDDKGQYTSAVAYDSTGKLDKYYTGITQNEFGQVMSWKEYDKDSVFRQEGKSEYNKNLQTSFTMKDSTGKVKTLNKYMYNDKGEQIESSSANTVKDSTTTKVTKYTYDTHDEKGNWTQKTTWDDKGKATKITKRTYTYGTEEEKK
jgi:hypothetical protein